MNKKALKTIMGLVVCCSLLAGLLAGCGGKETNNPAPTLTPEGNKDIPASQSVEKVEVWTGNGHSKDVLLQMVAEFNDTIGKEKGIVIDYQVSGSDYSQKLELALATGQGPDLFKQGQKRKFVESGYLMPLTELPGGEEYVNSFEGLFKNDYNIVDGEVYSVPYSVTTIGLIYNKDMFKKSGIVDEKGEAKPPTTWDEVREYAKLLTNPSAKEYGIILPMKWGGYAEFELLNPLISSVAVGHYAYARERAEYDWTATKPGFEWLLGIKEDESYFPGPEGLDNDPARAQFAEGRIGMKLAASWDVGVFTSQFPAKMDWGVAKIPVLGGGNTEYKQYMNWGDFLAVSSKAKDKDLGKIMEVYKFFHSEEVLTKLYETGKEIPYSADIIANAKNESDIKQWAEFAGMVEFSAAMEAVPTLALEGDDYKTVVDKIWLGSLTIDEGLAQLNKTYNDALQKGFSNGSINKEQHTGNRYLGGN